MKVSGKITLPQKNGVRDSDIVLQLVDYGSTCGNVATVELPEKAGIREHPLPLELTAIGTPPAIGKVTLSKKTGVREHDLPIELTSIGCAGGGISWCTCFPGSVTGAADFSEYQFTLELTLDGQENPSAPSFTNQYYISHRSSKETIKRYGAKTVYRDPTQSQYKRSTYTSTETTSGSSTSGGPNTTEEKSYDDFYVHKATKASIQQRGNMFYGLPWWMGSALEMPLEFGGTTYTGHYSDLYTLNDYYYNGIVPGAPSGSYTTTDERDTETVAGTFRHSWALNLSNTRDTTKQYRVDDEIINTRDIIQICNFYSPADVYVDGERVTTNPKFTKTQVMPDSGLVIEYQDGVPKRSGYWSGDPSGLDITHLGYGDTYAWLSHSKSTRHTTKRRYRVSGNYVWRTWVDHKTSGSLNTPLQAGEVYMNYANNFGSGFTSGATQPTGNPNESDFLIPVTENTWYFTIELGIHEGPVFHQDTYNKYKNGSADTPEDLYTTEEVNSVNSNYWSTTPSPDPAWYAGWGLYLYCSSSGQRFGPYMVTDHLSKYVQREQTGGMGWTWNYYWWKEENIDTSVEADVKKLENFIKDLNKTPQEVSFKKPEVKYAVPGAGVLQNHFEEWGRVPHSRPNKYKSVQWEKFYDLNSWIGGTPFGLSIQKENCKKMPPKEYPYLRIFLWLCDDDGARMGGDAYFVLDWSFEEDKWVGQQNRVKKQKRIWSGSWTETEPSSLSKIEVSKQSNEKWFLKWEKVDPLKQVEQYRVIYQLGYGLKDKDDNDIVVPESVQITKESGEPSGPWHENDDNNERRYFILSNVNPNCPNYNDASLCPPAKAQQKKE